MKIKTSETTPIQLNWLVATAEGYDARVSTTDFFGNAVSPCVRILNWDLHPELSSTFFTPSTNREQGGLIVEREQISTIYRMESRKALWTAYNDSMDNPCEQGGPTQLITAMRCYVATRLGDEVDIPEELIP